MLSRAVSPIACHELGARTLAATPLQGMLSLCPSSVLKPAG
jgi:hypothetical protein